MKKLFCSFVLFISVNAAFSQSTFTLDSTILTSRDVITGIDIPWEITWGPDNYIWMTERYGRVSRVNPATGQQSVLLDISSTVYDNSESGLLGLALHPDFNNTPHVFIVYTYLSGSNIRERVERYTYNGTALVNPLTLIQGIVGNTTHDGSRLFILPDTTMLVSTGDAQNQSLPQDTTKVEGKILRMKLDGTVPSDNPIPGSLVWSIGHRNAQGLWRAPNGLIYSSEHGPTSDDELNILKPLKNYGWPTVAGYCDSPPENAFCASHNVVEPIAAWTPTIAPSDIIWYDHPAIPEFKDKLLMTVLKDKKLIAFGFNAAGDTVKSEKHYLTNAFQRLRDICISPDGKIYLATNGALWSNTNPFTHKIVELSNNAYIPTQIEKQENKLDIKIGPNPLAQSQQIVLRTSKIITGEICFYNLLGQTIEVHKINSVETIINHKLSKGVYFWKINIDEEILSGKIIVK